MGQIFIENNNMLSGNTGLCCDCLQNREQVRQNAQEAVKIKLANYEQSVPSRVDPLEKGCKNENPQKLTQLSSRSHPRHLVGKMTAQKDITIDTTSDSQVNSNFPNRWSPASLTFNNYFYLFLYLYIT